MVDLCESPAYVSEFGELMNDEPFRPGSCLAQSPGPVLRGILVDCVQCS